MLKQLFGLALVGAFAVSLPACNTVKGAAEGAERDIDAVGENLSGDRDREDREAGYRK